MKTILRQFICGNVYDAASQLLEELNIAHTHDDPTPMDYSDFVDSFPMNAAGKILKYKMREDAVKKLGLQKADSIVTA